MSSTAVFVKPSEVESASAPPVRKAGGDNEVERAKDGRPYIGSPCSDCNARGKVPSEKRPGKEIQCPRCKGDGFRRQLYTRTTTYIDVIEDKSNLDTWGKRMVLIGVARDPKLLNGITELDPTVKDEKDILNRRAETAATVAGAKEKSEKGTQLHALSELADEGKPLPDDISFEDVLDIYAYVQATKGFSIRHMEQLVVQDDLGVAGTPDRISEWSSSNEHPLIAPDGTQIREGELLITDLKTGSVEYGGLKMAMQLSIYSRAKLYDKKTHERVELGNVNQRWGVIMHLPAGSGECTLYWADLELGWEAVEVATLVRSLRRRSKNALVQFSSQDRLDNAGQDV